MNYNKLIDFVHYETSLCLLELRTNFKWPEFKKLKTLEEKFNYAAKNLQQVGKGEQAGSTRATFILSNRFVLKIARPEKFEAGAAQNKSEVKVYTNPISRFLVPKIYDFDPNYTWIVSEIARPLNSYDEFEKLSGIQWYVFEDIIANYKNPKQAIQAQIKDKQDAIEIWSRRGNQQKVKYFKEIVKTLENALHNKIVAGVLNLINKVGVMPGDLREIRHWAKTAEGRLVIIDTGFTRESYNVIKVAANIK